MKLHADWKKTLRHAWSVRLGALAAVSEMLQIALPYLPSIPFLAAHPGVLTILTVIAIVGGLIARVLPQKEFENADQ